jgi:thioredoxin reductase
MLYSVVILLIGVLLALGRWQRHVDRRRSVEVLTELEASRIRGTNRGHNQHPHIDVLKCMGCGSCVKACPETGVLAMLHGTAHLVHASRCIGHGACERACPVGALTVGLGDVSSRSDLPALSSTQETSVPGLYVAGELSGLALIRNAVAQGVRAVDDIATKLAGAGDRSPGVVDVLVVGAGPAGIAATLRAIELNLTYAAIDQEEAGGAIRKYPRGKLTMTQPMDLPLFGRLNRTQYLKEELVQIWDQILQQHQVHIRTRVRLTGVERLGEVFLARTSEGEIRSRYVVLALGRRGTPRKLGVPGEAQGKVLYQLVDAATYTGQHLLVVGGGDSAVEAAAALAEQPGNTVTLSYRKAGFFRLKQRNEENVARCVRDGRIRALFSTQVRCISADSVTLAFVEDATGDGRSPAREETVPNDTVFIFAGGDPPYPLLRSMGIRFFADEATVQGGGAAARAA